jgi:hypothetical protein
MAFYRLSRQTLALHVGGAQGAALGGVKGQPRSKDAFEVAVANACGGLGYAVLFGGTVLGTQGVDLVAFDQRRGTAYAISVTVSNDIADKLRELKLVRGQLDVGLSASWKVKPVIITGQPAARLLQGDRQSADQERTLLLTLEDLQGLIEEPVDLDALDAALQREAGPSTSRGMGF